MRSDAEIPSPTSEPPEPEEPAAAGHVGDPVERLHPFTILFEALRVARAFLIPAVIVAFAGRGDDGFGRMGLILILLLGIPAVVRAIVKYGTFRFGIVDRDLVFAYGLLSRHRRTIPLTRIQNIDVRQSALQRMFGMAEVRVETASGDSADAELSVLPVARAAEIRGDLIRERRSVAAARSTAGEGGAAEIADANVVSRERVASLSVPDLMILGATSNRAGLIAAGLFGLLQFVLQLGIDLPDPTPGAEAVLEATPGMLVAAAVLGMLLLVFLIGWVLSIVTVTIEYFGFTLERTGGEVEKRYGLLSKRHATVPLHRVQTVRVEQSILRRPFDLAALRVESAGSEMGRQQRGRVEAFLPLARVHEVPGLVREVFPTCDLGSVRLSPVHPRARFRAAVRYSVPVLVGTVAVMAWQGWGWIALILLLALSVLAAHLFYRSLGYALHPDHVVARAGVWNRVTWIVPYHKIQTVHVTETPFQRRHGLGTLVIDTAAGGVQDGANVRDLARDDALRLMEELHRRAGSAIEVRGEERRAAAG